MTSKKETELLTQLLNLDGVKVQSQQHHPGIGMILQVQSNRQWAACPHCGTKSRKLHQNHRYIIKDLPWSSTAVFLEVNRRQFKCKRCQKPFSEELEFVKKRRSYTKRLAQRVIQEVKDANIQSVARKGIVTPEEIERMLKDVGQELLEFKPVKLTRLGIDEISLVKGQGKYCAVLVDLKKGQLIAILSSRKVEAIEEVLTGWGKEVLENIEEVSIDLWKGYKSLVKKLMPKATVVADRFHVMTQINRELDTERKRENRQVEKEIKAAKNALQKSQCESKREGLKKSKYILLKNGEDLNEPQKNKLEKVKNVSEKLGRMYELKEEFRYIFEESDDWLTGVLKLGSWLKRAKKYFSSSCQTLSRWLPEIVSYFDHRTTSGVVEGINNKLKLIKRSAYGFRNFDNFRVRCLLNWHCNC